MAEQSGSLLESFGDLSRSVTSVSGSDAPMKDTNKFANWFQSEQGQVMMGGLFNAIGSMGAGLAGLPPGGRDTSSLARGAAMASQGWNIAQDQFDSNKFIQYVDKRIAAEEGADEPDQDKLMTLQMMRRDPEGYIKSSQSGENWWERMNAAYGFDAKKKKDAYEVSNKAATDFFDKIVDVKNKKLLKDGDQKTLEMYYRLYPDITPYWIGDGGVLDGVMFGKEGEKKSGKSWLSSLGWGKGEKTSDSEVATVPTPAPTPVISEPQTGAEKAGSAFAGWSAGVVEKARNRGGVGSRVRGRPETAAQAFGKGGQDISDFFEYANQPQ